MAISPHDTQESIAHGARLVDIRGTNEYPHEHIPEADLASLSVLEQSGLPAKLRREQIIFHRRAGKHTSNNVDKLAAVVVPAETFLFKDGIDGWKKAGLPVTINESQPLPLVYQIQIAAGGLMLIGIVLDYTVNSDFFLSGGFVGAGLLLTGISGFCRMAGLLDGMPWSQRAWEVAPDTP